MSTTRPVLLSDIEESKCGACGELVRRMGPYCSQTKQMLDIADMTGFDNILLHCGGPYPLRCRDGTPAREDN